MTSDLAAALRAWRDRVQPSHVGLAAGPSRKSPGLRREELALLAGVSVDYLVRLEQGRSSNPSPQVLAALARALRLTVQERDLLYRAAGVAPPAAGTISRHLSPGLQRVLDRLGDTPVGVFTASWELVAANRLWQALFGDTSGGTSRERNLAWRYFTGGQSIIVRTEEEERAFAREIVADLHAALATHPHDGDLVTLVADLRRLPAFERLWGDYAVARRVSDRKTVDSPVVGLVTFDCDVLTAPDSDLRLVIYTAVPGSVDEDKLDLLRVTGLQTLQSS